eukprot:204949-Amphidinium_carterae.1
MPSAFSSSSGSALGEGTSGRASGSSATSSGTNPGSERVSASFCPGLPWEPDAVPPPDLEGGGSWRQRLPPIVWRRPGERQLPVTVAVHDFAEQIPFCRLRNLPIPEVELPADCPQLLLSGCFSLCSQLAHVNFAKSCTGRRGYLHDE